MENPVRVTGRGFLLPGPCQKARIRESPGFCVWQPRMVHHPAYANRLPQSLRASGSCGARLARMPLTFRLGRARLRQGDPARSYVAGREPRSSTWQARTGGTTVPDARPRSERLLYVNLHGTKPCTEPAQVSRCVRPQGAWSPDACSITPDKTTGYLSSHAAGNLLAASREYQRKSRLQACVPQVGRSGPG